MAAEITTDMPFPSYAALPALNWSKLKHLARTPAHFKHILDNPPVTTAACTIGRALHTVVLEGPETFAAQYAVAPQCDRRTKAGKETWAAFQDQAAGRDVLTDDQHESVAGMAAAVLAHPKARKLIERCAQREVVATWQDADTGLDCKSRIDAWADQDGLVLDLKTCQDAGPDMFRRTAWNYQFHGQASFYLDGLRAAGGSADSFLFVAVENSAPYAVAVYLADDDFLQAGRQLVRQCLEKYAECMSTNTWPGYGDAIQALSLPHWARMAT